MIGCKYRFEVTTDLSVTTLGLFCRRSKKSPEEKTRQKVAKGLV